MDRLTRFARIATVLVVGLAFAACDSADRLSAPEGFDAQFARGGVANTGVMFVAGPGGAVVGGYIGADAPGEFSVNYRVVGTGETGSHTLIVGAGATSGAVFSMRLVPGPRVHVELFSSRPFAAGTVTLCLGGDHLVDGDKIAYLSPTGEPTTIDTYRHPHPLDDRLCADIDHFSGYIIAAD